MSSRDVAALANEDVLALSDDVQSAIASMPMEEAAMLVQHACVMMESSVESCNGPEFVQAPTHHPRWQKFTRKWRHLSLAKGRCSHQHRWSPAEHLLPNLGGKSNGKSKENAREIEGNPAGNAKNTG